MRKDHFPHTSANHPFERAVKKQLTCEIPIPKGGLETESPVPIFASCMTREGSSHNYNNQVIKKKKASESSKCNFPTENSTGADTLPQNINKILPEVFSTATIFTSCLYNDAIYIMMPCSSGLPICSGQAGISFLTVLLSDPPVHGTLYPSTNTDHRGRGEGKGDWTGSAQKTF